MKSEERGGLFHLEERLLEVLALHHLLLHELLGAPRLPPRALRLDRLVLHLLVRLCRGQRRARVRVAPRLWRSAFRYPPLDPLTLTSAVP